MTQIISPASSAPQRPNRGTTRMLAHAERPRTPCRGRSARPCSPLARYTDASARPREVIVQPGAGGSVLVVDRDATTLGDRRLLAHLGADEPAANAARVCGHYLEVTRGRGCRCRPLTRDDFQTAPDAEPGPPISSAMLGTANASALERPERSFRLDLLQSRMSIPELRWRSHPPTGADGEPHLASVRAVVACLQAYEPVRSLTLSTLALHNHDSEVSTTVLRAELERLLKSPIVLNRRLRAVVLETIEREGLSASELAIRCGRVKRDRRGNESGETSWLARRLGILPEAGREAPTPWIHSDVLALIARRGLGISPREVEL
jgi:hypothetical protein